MLNLSLVKLIIIRVNFVPLISLLIRNPFPTFDEFGSSRGNNIYLQHWKYEIYNLDSGSIEFSALYTSSQELSINHNDHLILSENETFFQTDNLYSGAVITSIVYNPDYSNYHQKYLHWHTLFNGTGSRMTFREKWPRSIYSASFSADSPVRCFRINRWLFSCFVNRSTMSLIRQYQSMTNLKSKNRSTATMIKMTIIPNISADDVIILGLNCFGKVIVFWIIIGRSLTLPLFTKTKLVEPLPS